MSADGSCWYYGGKACAPDDPRLLALIAQVGPVEVRPAAQAPHPPSARHSHPSNRPMNPPARFAPRRRSRRPWPRRCIPTPHTVADGRATQPNHQSHCSARPRSDACTDRFAEVVTREALLHPNNRRLVHTKGPSRQLRCHATVQHAAVPNAAPRGGLCCFATPLGLTGRGSRGQPAAALGGARSLRPPSSAWYSRGTHSLPG